MMLHYVNIKKREGLKNNFRLVYCALAILCIIVVWGLIVIISALLQNIDLGTSKPPLAMVLISTVAVFSYLFWSIQSVIQRKPYRLMFNRKIILGYSLIIVAWAIVSAIIS